MTTTDIPTRREVLGIMAAYLADNDLAKEAAARAGAAKAALKSYLETSGDDGLWDGETGRGVRLQRRTGPPTYDVSMMPDELVLSLARLALLDVNVVALRSQEGRVIEAADALQYRTPGAESWALVEAKP